ncbi:MAG: PrsW family intramembrane metalloprotease [Salinivirgaceae bacterium]
MNLLIVASVPVFIILAYVYYRDRYEREPLKLLIEGLVAGGVIVFPVIYFENLMHQLGVNLTGLGAAAWTAFMVAALIEELFKFFAVYVLIWKNPEFNEMFDGVVYAVFVSLGFALVENIGYVFGSETGITVGLLRAFTAVPAHAMFGVMMGYRFGLARFIPSKRLKYLGLAFLVPFLFHGVYDFILMSQNQYLVFLFLPFVFYLLWRSLLRIKQLIPNSAFNPDHHKDD